MVLTPKPDVTLTGSKLVNGKYVSIPMTRKSDGLIWGHSAVLGLDVCWDRGMTRFRDPMSGEFLPNDREMKEERDTERTGRLAAEAQRDIAETQLDEERSRRLAAEAEMRRLREQLRDRQE